MCDQRHSVERTNGKHITKFQQVLILAGMLAGVVKKAESALNIDPLCARRRMADQTVVYIYIIL